MLKSLALRIPRIKALVSQRDALFLERAALLSQRERLLGTQGLCQEKRIDEVRKNGLTNCRSTTRSSRML
jgi:hypothetical protein